MKWTIQDAIRFHNWELDMLEVEACQRLGIKVEAPQKPANYDLWKQGDDPLKLASTKGVCCQGGGLVPENWTSEATPVRLPKERLKQPNLL